MDEFYGVNRSRFRKGKVEAVAAKAYRSLVCVFSGTCRCNAGRYLNHVLLGVCSIDSCHVDNPELYYCKFLHTSTPQDSLNSHSSQLHTISVCSSVHCLVFILGCRPELALRCFFLSTVGVASCQIENVIC